jgi:hypothetical protein
MNRGLTIFAVSAALIVAGPMACKNNRMTSLVRRGDAVSSESIVGNWVNDRGTQLHITQSAGRSMRVATVRTGGEEAVFNGTLFNVKGTTVMEVPLTDPALLGADEAPVYHYGRVRVEGDTLMYRSIRPEWLETAGRDVEAFRAPIEGSEGWVTVADADDMRSLLEEAVETDAAWGAAEVFRRAE